MAKDARDLKIIAPSDVRRTLVVLLIYTGLALILTWPTVTHGSTHLPGDGGDDPAIAWNLWWVKHALLTEGQNPFQTDYLFYPIGINLAFYTLTVLNAVTSLPLTLNLGVVTASNLHMFLTFILAGYGTYLLTRYALTTMVSGQRTDDDRLHWLSAILAGLLYAFASSQLFYVALGQFNIASNHWVPFAVLYTLRTRANPRRFKNPIMTGLFLTMQTWTEMTYASFLLIFIGLYWLYGLLTNIETTELRRVWRRLQPHLRAAILLGLVFAIGISPILAQMLPDMLVEGDFLVEGGGFADTFSADLLGFVIPTMHHPLLGHLITQSGIGDFDKGQHIYIGFVLLALMAVAIYAGYRQREVRFWLIASLAFLLLSLGPEITVSGQVTGWPGPFTLLQNLPFFKANRYPSRYGVMLMLALSVLAGSGMVQLGRWLRRADLPVTPQSSPSTFLSRSRTADALLLGLSLLFLLEHLSAPLPQSDVRVPAAYELIAAEPGDFTVLDIPFAWRNGFRITGAPTTQFMFGQFYQTAHQKKLLQGNTSRNPEFKFHYFTDAPVINSLLALETGKTLPPERWEADRPLAADLLHLLNIRIIVVRPDDTQHPAVTPQAAIPYIEDLFPVEKIRDEASIIIYRVLDVPANDQGIAIDSTSPLAPLYFGEGWGLVSPGQPVAAQRRTVRLLLPLTDHAQRLAMQMSLPDLFQGSPQTVSLEIDNWQSPPQIMQRERQAYVFDLPAGAARAGLNDLYLHFHEVTRLPPVAGRELMSPPEITVLSAGEEVGDFGHIFVNGHDVSPNQRGYNVVALQPDERGRVTLRVADFDTHVAPTASEALVAFIKATPPGSLIMVAAADEASRDLSEQAERILHDLGARGDLRRCFRCSQALIAPLPADPGSAQHALDPLRPVGLTRGLGITEPTIAALLHSIRIEPLTESDPSNED